MVHFFLNLKYTEETEKLIDEEGKPSLVSEMLFQIMLATAVCRLFDKQSIYEFLFRTAIVLKKYGILPNFFTNDLLLQFEAEGEIVEVYLNDIVAHLGMEICDDPKNFISRDNWIENIDDYWKSAAIGAAFSSVPILAAEQIGKNEYNIGGVNKPGIPDKETIKLAKLFADSAIKTIGEARIQAVKKRVKERDKFLKDYQNFMDNAIIKEFNYLTVPLDIRDRFYHLIIGPRKADEKYYKSVINDPDSPLAHLVYLAWLYANQHVLEYEIVRPDSKKALTAEVNPIYEKHGFDYDYFDGINGLGIGINLAATYYDLGLDVLAHLLKEPE